MHFQSSNGIRTKTRILSLIQALFEAWNLGIPSWSIRTHRWARGDGPNPRTHIAVSSAPRKSSLISRPLQRIFRREPRTKLTKLLEAYSAHNQTSTFWSLLYVAWWHASILRNTCTSPTSHTYTIMKTTTLAPYKYPVHYFFEPRVQTEFIRLVFGTNSTKKSQWKILSKFPLRLHRSITCIGHFWIPTNFDLAYFTFS